MADKLIDEVERQLYKKTIHDIRQIARAVGVSRPADGRKENIIERILSIAKGETDPAAPSVRGAHPKSSEYDRQLVSNIFRCREMCLSSNEIKDEPSSADFTVSSGVKFDPLDFTAEGFLEQTEGKWFMRVDSRKNTLISDVFVSEYFINNFGLRQGDFISGKCKRTSVDELAGLTNLHTVNGIASAMLRSRIKFDELPHAYPCKRLHVSGNEGDYTGRIIDLFAPVGAGQRALITGPHGCGKTAVLKQIALGLKHNNPEIKIVAVMIDARPEEAEDFRSAIGGAEFFISLFDEGMGEHIRKAKLALEYSKRQTELKNDVVIILDDLTRLARAYNFYARQTSVGLEYSALDSAKKFLGAAKNAGKNGSLTIVAALSTGCGDAVDEAAYSGLKDLGNMRFVLSGELARSRVFPPVDIFNSFTSGDERLLSVEEIGFSVKLRNQSLEEIFRLFAQTKSNEELIYGG